MSVRPHDAIPFRADRAQLAEIKAAVRSSNSLSQLLEGAMTEGLLLLDRDLHLSVWNDAASRILGLSKTEIEARSLLDPRWRCLRDDGSVCPMDEYPAVVALRTGRPVESFPLGVIGDDESVRWILVNARPIIDESDVEVSAVIVSIVDITKRRHASDDREAQVRRRADALVRLSSSDAIRTRGLNAAIAEFAEVAARTLEVSRASIWLLDANGAQLRCRHVYEVASQRHLAPNELTMSAYPNYSRAVREDRTIAASDVSTDPRTREFHHVYSAPLGIVSLLDAPIRCSGRMVGVVCHEMVGIRRDWTPDDEAFAASIADLVAIAVEGHERQAAVNARWESELRFHQLAESIAEVFWSVDATTGYVSYVSPAFELVWGRAIGDVIGLPDSVRDTIHPEDRVVFDASTQQQQLGCPTKIEYRIIRPDGSIRWIWDSGFPVRESSGAIVRINGIALDITERKNTEQALRASEERLRVFNENMPGAAYSYVARPDGSRRLLFASRGWTDLLGPRTAADIRDDMNRIIPLIHPDDRGAHRAAGDHARSTGTNFDLELRVLTDTGYRWVRSISRPIPEPDGSIMWHSLLLDINERREAERARAMLERQLWQAQKYEAIGTLAAGVAHDLNNVLTAIHCAAILARKELVAAHPAMGPLSMIETACAQAHGVTRGMLTFARESDAAPAPVDLVASVEAFLPVIRQLMPAEVLVETTMPELRVWIRADENQLHQVLMNLTMNARDAMPSGGVIRIRVERGNDGDRDSAFLIVEDTGVGMSPEVRERIFDPFFTTKPRGKGTGLGLSVVMGITRSNQGRITVDSAEGLGSTFKVSFPSIDAPAPAMPAAPAMARPALHVLLADDHDQVRELLAAGLRHEGFKVTTAADGSEALRIAGGSQVFDAVIVDADMPGLKGQECAERIHAIRPGLPVLMVSGNPTDAPMPGSHIRRAMQKPITPAQLADAVVQVVTARG